MHANAYTSRNTHQHVAVSVATQSHNKKSDTQSDTSHHALPLFLQHPLIASQAIHGGQPAQFAASSNTGLTQGKSAMPLVQRQPEDEAEEELLQPGLTVGEPDDKYENEADQVADHVMRMPANASMPRPAVQTRVQTPMYLQRLCSSCEEEMEQNKQGTTVRAKSNGESVTTSGHQVAQAVRSTAGGSAVPAHVRNRVEPVLNRDLSHVRVHDNSTAQHAAQQINARAFTHQDHIYLGNGQSANDTELMAHELAHVVQQGTARARIQRKLSAEEKAMDLQSDRFRDDARLQQAYDNSQVMKRGETSEGVKTLQRALKDLGYNLPVSFEKTGDADGVFGKETHDAVYQYQVDNDLVYKDGKAGRETLGALDAKFLGAQATCNIAYFAGPMSHRDKDKFIRDNFDSADRPAARKVLDDLCNVQSDVLTFSSEQELRDEIMKRIRISKYTQTTQTSGAFGYPESAAQCPGKIGNALLDAQVNKAAKDYWDGPKLEQRSVIKNRHYYFQLTETKGKSNGYEAMSRLFTYQDNICDRTLIHCDTLITLVQSLAYADTIGKDVFNQKIKSGDLNLWLTYDGMTITEGGTEKTPVSQSVYRFRPSSENDLLIGDHVVFWNHLAYDAISAAKPGPWRLENAILVDIDSSGKDLYEGHGAPDVGGTVKPGNKDEVLMDLKDVYNAYAKDAIEVTRKVDNNEAGAQADLHTRYPRVVPGAVSGTWLIKETDNNMQYRSQQYYVLRELTSTSDPELIGLKDPQNPSQMNTVNRPVESR